MDWAAEIVTYLNNCINSFATYHTALKQKPQRFAVVRQSSVRASNEFLSRYVFIISCWAKERQDAAVMAIKVRNVMFDAKNEIPNVSDVSLIGDYDEPDPPLDYRQRVLTFELTINE